MTHCRLCGRYGLLALTDRRGLCSRCRRGIAEDLERIAACIEFFAPTVHSHPAMEARLRWRLSMITDGEMLALYERLGIRTGFPPGAALAERYRARFRIVYAGFVSDLLARAEAELRAATTEAERERAVRVCANRLSRQTWRLQVHHQPLGSFIHEVWGEHRERLGVLEWS